MDRKIVFISTMTILLHILYYYTLSLFLFLQINYFISTNIFLFLHIGVWKIYIILILPIMPTQISFLIQFQICLILAVQFFP